jgi:hypothetical protein
MADTEGLSTHPRCTSSDSACWSRSDPELKLTPERLRRPGAVVLEVDDEDPAFDHLEHYDEHVGDSHLDVRMRRAAGE